MLHEDEPETYCDYEYHCKNYNDIISLPFKEDKVPYKIMSFDIEADSSHGDFPVPKKSYRKGIGELITYWHKYEKEIRNFEKECLLFY